MAPMKSAPVKTESGFSSHWCCCGTCEAKARPHPSTDSCRDRARADLRHCFEETTVPQKDFDVRCFSREVDLWGIASIAWITGSSLLHRFAIHLCLSNGIVWLNNGTPSPPLTISAWKKAVGLSLGSFSHERIADLIDLSIHPKY